MQSELMSGIDLALFYSLDLIASGARLVCARARARSRHRSCTRPRNQICPRKREAGNKVRRCARVRENQCTCNDSRAASSSVFPDFADPRRIVDAEPRSQIANIYLISLCVIRCSKMRVFARRCLARPAVSHDSRTEEKVWLD